MVQNVSAAPDGTDPQLSPATKQALETVVKKATLSVKPVILKEGAPVYLDRSKPISQINDSFTGKNNANEKNVTKGMVTGKLFGKNMAVSSTVKEADSETLLDQAYNALLNGQQEAATTLYKQVLARDKNNNAALFGLATIYQRNKNDAQARAIYTSLLSRDPSNQDALNNFLMLVAEESPEGALVELKKLEALNPDFSPLSAQIGMIYARLGKPQKAIRSLNKALAMSPENQSYRYNLAVIYDQLGAKEQAISLYKELLTASFNGVVLPGSTEDIRERIIFLSGEKS